MDRRKGMRDFSEVMRDEMIMKGPIMDVLKDAPMTIPSVAGTLNRPIREVTLWMMDMWRYGFIEETGRPDEEGYYSYRLKKEG